MGRFVVKKAEDGYRFDFFASSGILIATSETYTTKSSCMGGIESVVRAAPKAELHDLTDGAAQISNP